MPDKNLVPAPVVESSARKAGKALPETLRHQMESKLGQDFNNVRVHEGHQATLVGAKAYTQGSNIFFKPGEYRPHDDEGRKLLSQELAHVVQQGQPVQKVQVPKGMVEVPTESAIDVTFDRDVSA